MATLASTYLLLNGNLHTQTSTIFNIRNRALAFGDCVIETIHTCADRLCFFDKHLQHLREGMEMAMMKIPPKFYNREREFSTEISKLITKNRIFYGSLVTIMVFRSSYTQLSTQPDTIEYVVYCEPLPELGYTLNERGLRLGLIDAMPFTASPMSNYCTHDYSVQRIVLHKKCLKANLDEAIITNASGHIVETAGSGNIFFIKEDTLITPPLIDGCKDDVIRRIILDTVAPQLGLKTICDKSMHISDIKHIDEVFTASTRQGIRWVAAYKSQRYMRAKTTVILNKLTKLYEAQQ